MEEEISSRTIYYAKIWRVRVADVVKIFQLFRGVSKFMHCILLYETLHKTCDWYEMLYKQNFKHHLSLFVYLYI
jgi:hypothetical protein